MIEIDGKKDRRGKPLEEWLNAKLKDPGTAGALIAAHVERDPRDSLADHLTGLRKALIDVADANGLTLS